MDEFSKTISSACEQQVIQFEFKFQTIVNNLISIRLSSIITLAKSLRSVELLKNCYKYYSPSVRKNLYMCMCAYVHFVLYEIFSNRDVIIIEVFFSFFLLVCRLCQFIFEKCTFYNKTTHNFKYEHFQNEILPEIV